MIKAIETMYKGYYFRSRLEARWAVFFDAMRYKWKYEDQGYEKKSYYNDKLITQRYLPDFVIPNLNGKLEHVFAEVKGDPMGLQNNSGAFRELHDWGGVLPGFNDSYNERNAGLVLLGEIPLEQYGKTIFHPIITHWKGLHREWGTFTPTGFAKVEQSSLTNYCDLERSIVETAKYSKELVIETRWSSFFTSYPEIMSAYAAARSARFEHRQSGATNVTPALAFS